jgi:hypothetical protein
MGVIVVLTLMIEQNYNPVLTLGMSIIQAVCFIIHKELASHLRASLSENN